jgi:hypothetical protein
MQIEKPLLEARRRQGPPPAVGGIDTERERPDQLPASAFEAGINAANVYLKIPRRQKDRSGGAAKARCKLLDTGRKCLNANSRPQVLREFFGDEPISSATDEATKSGRITLISHDDWSGEPCEDGKRDR